MSAALDVFILGAGPAGCATALALRRRGVARVMLVDQPLQQAFRIGEAAAPDVPGLVAQLTDFAMPCSAPRPYLGNLSCWGGHHQRDDFLRRGLAPGWQLDRALFDQSLRDHAVAAGVQLRCPARCDDVRRAAEGWSITLDDGSTWQARVLVDASGRRARLATRLGATRHHVDRQVALAVRCPPGSAVDLAGHVLVESCAEGWWYASPLPNGEVLVSLMTDPDVARAGCLREWPALTQAWAASRVLREQVRWPAQPQPVVTFAAHSACVDRAAGPGWMVVGDALMSLDPLSACGLSGALRDGLEAAEVVMPWLEGQDPAPAGRAWGQRAARSWGRFLVQRQQLYGQERAWADRLFWQRRHAPLPMPSAR